jgi:hypothetical protein
MPWHVEKQGDKYIVVKSADGKKVGTHSSRTAALKHMRALYANTKHGSK